MGENLRSNGWHTPVMVEEALELLRPSGTTNLMVDATLGEGGHAEAFLQRNRDLLLIGIDADEEILERAKERLATLSARITFANMWFSDFFTQFDEAHERQPEIILFDLGISRYHYELGKRGFSFSRDEELDMRLDTTMKTTARDIINHYPAQELVRIFSLFGEERYAQRIAGAIVKARGSGAVYNSRQLAQIVARVVPRRKIHPATRIFQALRIAVNDELEQLRTGLNRALEVLIRGGRLGVISFHSLEDRIVKNTFSSLNKACSCPPNQPICKCGGLREYRVITKKPTTPQLSEIKNNPASRSAKLRVIEKL